MEGGGERRLERWRGEGRRDRRRRDRIREGGRRGGGGMRNTPWTTITTGRHFTTLHYYSHSFQGPVLK